MTGVRIAQVYENNFITYQTPIMKKPMISLPILMIASLVIILITLVAFQFTQYDTDYMADMMIDESKVNLPGPYSDVKEEESTDLPADVNEGKIVFLKEDLQEETEEAPVELTTYNEDNLTEDEAFMKEMTTSETLSSLDGTDKYLVIAGTYTDDMVVLSKQAQYLNKGYSAEIIQFEDTDAKNICMGRYSDVSQAEEIANEIETNHDISTYVYHQAPESR